MGKPLTEEHKKAIAEALRKKFGNKPKPPAPLTGQKKSAVQTYQGSMTRSADLDKQLEGAKSALGGKINKAQKDQLKKKILAIKAQQKKEKDLQKGLKTEAVRMKGVERAKQQAAKATENIKKAEGLEKDIGALMQKVIKPEQKERLQKRLTALASFKAKQNAVISDAKKTMSGREVKKPAAPYLSELCLLAEKEYGQWRTLTQQEQRVDFKYLNEQFDTLQSQVRVQLESVVNEDIEKAIKRISGRVKAGDIQGVGDTTFVNPNRLKGILSDYIKQAYQVGKKTASKEMKVEAPPTPTLTNQLITLKADQTASKIAYTADTIATATVVAGLSKNVAVPDVFAAMDIKVRGQVSQDINDVAVSIIADAIGDGRRFVFDKNKPKLRAYQRSEILDDRTCNICMSLDQRLVEPDDPMAKLNEIHTNCRGLWMPILSTDDEPVGTWGVPVSITNRFDTIAGVPQTNGFKQMKKIINPGNEDVQQEIQSRLMKKKNPFEGPGAAPSPRTMIRTADEMNTIPPYEDHDIPVKNIVYHDSEAAEEVANDIDKGRLSKTKGPILVVKEGDNYHILDGAHRAEQAKRAGEAAIEAHVITKEDYDKYGGNAWDNINRPPFSTAQANDYNLLSPSQRELYDNLRKNASLSHTDALKESKAMDKYEAQVKENPPTMSPMGLGDVEKAVYNLIKDKYDQ